MSRCRSTSLVLLSALIAFAICAFGQVQDIQVVQVPVVTGARIQFFRLPWPSTRFVVGKIIQDNQGFLWLGAADGLRRYDSYGFMRVPDSEASRSTGFIISESLMKDRSGRIWFGTEDSLGRYDPVTGNFKQYRPQPGRRMRSRGAGTSDQRGPGWPHLARNRRRHNSSGSGHVESDLLPAAVQRRSVDRGKTCHLDAGLAGRHSLDHEWCRPGYFRPALRQGHAAFPA